MWGWNTPTLFPGTPPLLSLFRKVAGPQFHEKHPKFAPSNRLTSRRLLFGTLAGLVGGFLALMVFWIAGGAGATRSCRRAPQKIHS